MALLRKLLYRKPPDGLLEICDRVHVFDCCFTTDARDEVDYRVYIRGIVRQLQGHIPDASILVLNFRDGEGQGQIGNFLSDFQLTVMDYPRHYEGCPVLKMEVIVHFLKSSESWLHIGSNNLLLMHCERGGWPILAFVLAALLIYRKHYSGEQKTLDMIYKQSPREFLQCVSPLNPIPSQLRYLQYVSRRNMASIWPPLDSTLTLDCVIIRLVPDFDGEGGCRPIFRIYGQDPILVADRSSKLLFSTSKKSKTIRKYKQDECELVKIDINCQIQGDVVLECINLNDDMEHEEMIFRVMFNTGFVRSNILMLNRNEIDILWNAKDRFPMDFRSEFLFSDTDATASVVPVDLSCFEEKEGLPVEAFAKVHEIFSHVDWLDPKTDAALNVLQQITASNVVPGRLETYSSGSVEASTSLLELINEKVQEKQKLASSENAAETFSSLAPENKHLLLQKPSEGADVNQRKAEPQLPGRLESEAMEKDARKSTTVSAAELFTFADMGEKKPMSRDHSSLSATGITHQFPGCIFLDSSLDVSEALKSVEQKGVSKSPTTLQGPLPPPPIQPPLTVSATKTITSFPLPPPEHPPPSPPSPTLLPPLPPPPAVPQWLPQLSSHQLLASKPEHPTLAQQSEKYFQDRNNSSLVPLLPTCETSVSSSSFHESSSNSTSSSPALIVASLTVPSPPPPRPPPFLNKNQSNVAVPSPPPPPPPTLPHSGISTSPNISFPAPPPPLPVLTFSSKFSPALKDSAHVSSAPPPPPPPPPATSFKPPPPPPGLAFSSKFDSAMEDSSHVPSAPPPPPASFSKGVSKSSSGCPAPPALGGFPAISNGRNLSCSISSRNNQTKKLKPLHWLKLTRAVSGSLWAEAQKSGEASKAPEIDISELETLFAAAAPKSDQGKSSEKSNSRAPAKFDKVQLIEHRRAYNCEIMLSKVKVPLHDLMSSVLALEDSALDVDQVDNLIKFCPTKEEVELLKGYKGEKEKLGKCEQFFLELMQVPRAETKLRVFSFKIQFRSQVSYLRKSLNAINSASAELKNSIKLKRIMQTILQLGNALNQGTSRGSAIGFRLDSLPKLVDTRARISKITLMHYLCKVLAEKLPDVIDFSKDLASLEPASKIQLKFLAEEMQAISKGLEKVMQELSSSENDGPVSENFCQNLKKFLHFAETEVRSLASLYSGVGRNVDALILYFGEDPARCPFEQVISTLLNFVRMFNQAHEQNCKELELEMKKGSEGTAK